MSCKQRVKLIISYFSLFSSLVCLILYCIDIAWRKYVLITHRIKGKTASLGLASSMEIHHCHFVLFPILWLLWLQLQLVVCMRNETTNIRTGSSVLYPYHLNSVTSHKELQQRLYGSKSCLVKWQLQAYLVRRQPSARSSCCSRNGGIRSWYQLIWSQTKRWRWWKTSIRGGLGPQDMEMGRNRHLTENLLELASCFRGRTHRGLTFLFRRFLFFFSDLR